MIEVFEIIVWVDWLGVIEVEVVFESVLLSLIVRWEVEVFYEYEFGWCEVVVDFGYVDFFVWVFDVGLFVGIFGVGYDFGEWGVVVVLMFVIFGWFWDEW